MLALLSNANHNCGGTYEAFSEPGAIHPREVLHVLQRGRAPAPRVAAPTVATVDIDPHIRVRVLHALANALHRHPIEGNAVQV